MYVAAQIHIHSKPGGGTTTKRCSMSLKAFPPHISKVELVFSSNRQATFRAMLRHSSERWLLDGDCSSSNLLTHILPLDLGAMVSFHTDRVGYCTISLLILNDGSRIKSHV